MTDIEILRKISDDCERDATTLDGQPFNGKTVATQLGQLYAMVQAIARITASRLEEIEQGEQ